MKIRHIYFEPKKSPWKYVHTDGIEKSTHHFKGGNELHGIRTRIVKEVQNDVKMQPSAITHLPWMQQPIVQGRSVRGPYDSSVAHS